MKNVFSKLNKKINLDDALFIIFIAAVVATVGFLAYKLIDYTQDKKANTVIHENEIISKVSEEYTLKKQAFGLGEYIDTDYYIYFADKKYKVGKYDYLLLNEGDVVGMAITEYDVVKDMEIVKGSRTNEKDY